MFTGIIEEIGQVAALTRRDGNLLLSISCKAILDGMKLGDSIAVSGACLTVERFDARSFTVSATSQTLDSTTLGDLTVGRKVNLERAMQLSDRLGGHLVQGHIDGIGRVAKIRFGTGSTDVHLDLQPATLKLVAPKGSICVDGVSLTVADKNARGVKLVIVPFTLQNTTLGELTPGMQVNIETDLIIRWLADRFPAGEVVETESQALPAIGPYHLED